MVESLWMGEGMSTHVVVALPCLDDVRGALALEGLALRGRLVAVWAVSMSCVLGVFVLPRNILGAARLCLERWLSV